MKLIVLEKNYDMYTITTRKCIEKYAKNMPTVQLVQIVHKYAILAYFYWDIWSGGIRVTTLRPVSRS